MGVRPAGFPAIIGALSGCMLLSCCHAAPNAVGESYCDAISDYATTENCADFQKQAAREADGNAAVNAPNPMDRGDTVSLSLAVAADPPKPLPMPAPLRESVPPQAHRHHRAKGKPTPLPTQSPSASAADATPAVVAPEATATYAPTPSQVVAPMPGHTDVFSLTVGEHVKATLDGDEGFRITPRSPATQLIHLGSPYPATLWNWDVTAVHGGTHTLRINTIVQAIDRNGQYHDLVGSPHAYSFTVKVGFWGKVQDSLQLAPPWIKLVTLVVVALTALFAALGKLRNAVLGAVGLNRKKAGRK